jgi:DNA-binding transcriptional LysR family regulator
MSGLETGEVDFVVVPANMVNTDHPHRVLFDDGYMVIAWTDNRLLGETLDLATYQRLGHVLFRTGKVGQPWFEQWYMNEHGDSRRVEVRVHSFSLMPQMVVGTDRIATLQSRLAQRYAQTLPLRLYALPMAAPKLTEVLQWNRLHDQDPGNRWLRERMAELAQRLSRPEASA